MEGQVNESFRQGVLVKPYERLSLEQIEWLNKASLQVLADAGIYPGPVRKVIETFERTGRTVPHNPAIDKQRAKFGLPPLPPVPVDEIRKLIELGPEEEDGEDVT